MVLLAVPEEAIQSTAGDSRAPADILLGWSSSIVFKWLAAGH